MSLSVASEFAALEAVLEDRRQRVETALRTLAEPGGAPAVERAIEDSLFAPAKRLRPILSLLVAEVLRGQPDALMPAAGAFEILARGWEGGPDPAARAAIARELARAIGLDGMIAGQSRDLLMTGQQTDFATLEFIHSRKTGALFMASAAVGALGARARPEEVAAVVAYAKN